MEYVKLGGSGLDVSRLCLGCMTFGQSGLGDHHWTLDEEFSRSILRHAIDAGINFFDTANVYSEGDSEEILGRALKDFTRREEVVIATKVYGRMRAGPNGGGLSRKVIMTEIDASLNRLGTDYVDLYQIHRFDPYTPIAETVEALHDIVKAGKARYVGASSMYAWQFATMLHVAESNGWTRFITMQNHLSLLYREEEREMLPLCAAKSVAVIPWSPLARGRLTRGWGEESKRSQSDMVGRTLYERTADADEKVVQCLSAVAAARGVSPAQIALAWVLGKKEVAAPIIGASKPKHIDDAVAALAITLSEDESRTLEEPYIPHAVSGI